MPHTWNLHKILDLLITIIFVNALPAPWIWSLDMHWTLSGPCFSERPLHPKEKVLEQALQWCKLIKPSSAYLLVKKVPIREGSCLFTGEWAYPSHIAQHVGALEKSKSAPAHFCDIAVESGALSQGSRTEKFCLKFCRVVANQRQKMLVSRGQIFVQSYFMEGL